MALRSYFIPDWLGLNTEMAPEVLPPGALVVAENWDLGKPSIAERRLGSTAWGAVISGGIKRLGFLRGADGDPDYLVALSTDAAYHGDVRTSWPNTSWTRINASTGSSFGSVGEEVVFQDNLFFANNQNPKVVLDDLNFRNAYLSAPNTHLSVSVSDAGNPSGTYYYKYTHRANRRAFRGASVIESNAAPCTAGVALTSQKALLRGFQLSEDAASTDRYIYRAKGAIGNQYYYIGSIGSATTHFFDNVADANVGEELHDETHTTPDELVSNPHHICAHRNRLFIGADNFDIAFTEIEVPYYWGSSTSSGFTPNKLVLNAEQTEGYITGLMSQWDVLVALTRGGIWEIAGDDMDNYAVRKVENIGCIAPQSLAQSPYGLFFLSNRGVEHYDGQQATEITVPIRAEIRALLNTSARGVWYNDRYLLRMSDTKMYAFWPPMAEDSPGKWATYALSSARWENEQFLVMPRAEKEALFGVSRLNSGQLVNCLATGIYTDDATQYSAELRTGYMDMQVPYKYKSVNRTQMEADSGSGTGGLYVVVIPGSQGEPVTASYSVGATDRQLGYGLRAGCVGTDFQLQIAHTGAQDMQVRRVNMEYTLREGSLR